MGVGHRVLAHGISQVGRGVPPTILANSEFPPSINLPTVLRHTHGHRRHVDASDAGRRRPSLPAVRSWPAVCTCPVCPRVDAAEHRKPSLTTQCWAVLSIGSGRVLASTCSSHPGSSSRTCHSLTASLWGPSVRASQGECLSALGATGFASAAAGRSSASDGHQLEHYLVTHKVDTQGVRNRLHFGS